MALLPLLGVLFSLAIAQSQRVLSLEGGSQYDPSPSRASSNANLIFNAIHSSLRQWGSSVQHNGMSFFPAIVPEGTLLYHGSWDAEPVTGFEWLAFEIQHAELFAQGHPMHSRSKTRYPRNMAWEWASESGVNRGDDDDEWNPGYIHIYQTSRPLKLLYVDGMSAAKCDFGPMDSQDLLLLNTTLDWYREWERANRLCQLAVEWDIEGFIRMEAGFEIIKCNFSTGLHEIAVNKKPARNNSEADGQWSLFEYVREVSQRYHGNMAGRILLDWSSMVSAFFYPTNLSNPDKASRDPRLSSAGSDQLMRIRSDIRTSLRNSKEVLHIQWQNVVDMIVARYSDRLQHLATDPPPKEFLSVLNNILNVYTNYEDPDSVANSIQTCSLHYLQSVTPSTEQDHLILSALKTVTKRICETLFDARELLIWPRANPEVQLVSSLVGKIQELNEWLDWPEWKFCADCGYEQVCFISMFPFGSTEDHFHPRCKDREEVNNGSIGGDCYFCPKRPRGPREGMGDQKVNLRLGF